MAETDRALLIPAIFGLVTISAGAGAWAVTSLGPFASTAQHPVYPANNSEVMTICDRFSREQRVELCNGLRSANATVEGVVWAKGSFYTSIAAVIVYACTLAAAIAAAMFSRRAADQTKRGADIAFKSLNQNEKSSELELRAYLTVTGIAVQLSQDSHLIRTKLLITVRNNGQTPAYIRYQEHTWHTNESSCSQSLNGERIVSPHTEATFVQDFAFLGNGRSTLTNMYVKSRITYQDYLRRDHTEDSFWTYNPAYVPATGFVSYNLDCHSQSDETATKFTSSPGEGVFPQTIIELSSEAKIAGAGHP